MKSSRSKKSRGPSKAVVERGFRVADQIQRDLAELLRGEVKDPRVGFVTITDVEVTPDYAHAKIFYSVFPDTPQQKASTQAGLAASRGFLRGRLGDLLTIHQTPDLHFMLDESVARGAAISALIEQANAANASNAATPQSDGDTALSEPELPR